MAVVLADGGGGRDAVAKEGLEGVEHGKSYIANRQLTD
jgi:hypothetical protein